MAKIHPYSFLLFFAFVFVVFSSCKKEDDRDWIVATFTGIDYTMTMCSGGYYFTIDDVRYRTYDVPDKNIINEHTVFPKVCLVKYTKPEGGCYDHVKNLVRVTDIKSVGTR